MDSNISLYEAVNITCKKSPDNTALIFMGKKLKYHQLINKIDLFANGINQLNIKKGEVITMALPNVLEAVISFYAVNKLGIISHMVHPITPVKQMKTFMKTTNSNTLIILDSFFDYYKELLDDEVKLILVTPVEQFSFIKKIGYKIINCKKLKNIRFNDQIIRFSSLYSNKPTNIIKTNPMAPSTYLHSGGTSGEPKTIELSNYAINYLASQVSYIMDKEDFTNKHMLGVLPMFHGFGLCMGIHGMLRFGGTNTLMPKFNADEAVDLIKKNRINYIIGVPSLFEALLKNKDFQNPLIKNIDQAFVGGDYVALDLKKRFDKAMENVGSKARLLEGYGLTEVVTVCAVNTIKNHKQNSVGKPLPGIDMAIVDLETKEFITTEKDGIIAVSGPTMMNGYLNDELATEESTITKDGKKWILTGDLGFIDKEGYVHFKQRLKRIIKVSGIPVLPAEIENLLMSLDSVSEVAAIGVPDEQKGFMVKLFIVWNQDKVKIDDSKIKDIIKQNLGTYAVPKQIVELKELPKTKIGKTNTMALEKM
ncbi:MAG: class I adenylate-forming enzyme family protein [Candidatus Izemoplasmatales bacterium]